MSACEGWAPQDAVTSPSDDSALTASISVPIISTNGQTTAVQFIPFRCSNGTQFTGPLDIAMTAGREVDLHQVTIRLAQGADTAQGPNSSVQAANTFDDDDLASAFGSTQIPGGTVKTFRFRTDLSCGGTAPEFVAAVIQFTEASGRKNSITVTAPFGSEVDLVRR